MAKGKKPCKIQFEDFYQEMVRYRKKHGNCRMPYDYVGENGVHYGTVLSQYRCQKREITPEQWQKLQKLGVRRSVKNRYQTFSKVYQLLKAYYEENGNCDVPSDYMTEEELNLGAMVANLRSGQRKVTPEQKKMLDALGFRWREHRK